MTDRKPPKSNAERAREFRARRKPAPVDNPAARYENVTEIVTAVTQMRNEIVALLSEIVTVLRDSSTPGPPLEGSLGVESSIPGKRNENRNVTRNAEERVWTNSFVARPGEIPRCPGCSHLIVNCQCDTDFGGPRRVDLA